MSRRRTNTHAGNGTRAAFWASWFVLATVFAFRKTPCGGIGGRQRSSSLRRECAKKFPRTCEIFLRRSMDPNTRILSRLHSHCNIPECHSCYQRRIELHLSNCHTRTICESRLKSNYWIPHHHLAYHVLLCAVRVLILASDLWQTKDGITGHSHRWCADE